MLYARCIQLVNVVDQLTTGGTLYDFSNHKHQYIIMVYHGHVIDIIVMEIHIVGTCVKKPV